MVFVVGVSGVRYSWVIVYKMVFNFRFLDLFVYGEVVLFIIKMIYFDVFFVYFCIVFIMYNVYCWGYIDRCVYGGWWVVLQGGVFFLMMVWFDVGLSLV